MSEKRNAFGRLIRTQAERKLNARRSPNGVWFGLGMMGLIGWSIVVPTLLGAALGIWLNQEFELQHNLVLTLMIIGLVIGCLNAWHWINDEDHKLRNDRRDDEV